MARKLNSPEEQMLNESLLAPSPWNSQCLLATDPLFQDIAQKRDTELLLSPELLAFFDLEFPLVLRR